MPTWRSRGFWTLTEEEAATFRAYLEKGGFVIFDDFAENRGGWDAFASDDAAGAFPARRWVELDGQHPIFHSFFEIDRPLDLIPPYDQRYRPIYYGVFEENDPARRLMAIVNFNNDISEYWEFAPTGLHAGVRHERGVQAGRELRHVRVDALRRRVGDGKREHESTKLERVFACHRDSVRDSWQASEGRTRG